MKAGVAALLGLLLAAPAQAAPRPLSTQPFHASVDSAYGSGAFGRWGVDARGLPRYRYTLDEQTSPIAPQAELAGRRDAWHQLGNARIVAMTSNHGDTELWSKEHQYEWLNHSEPGHPAGGFGRLGVAGRTYSTLRDDHPGAPIDFGLGYAGRHTAAGPIAVDEHVYAPYGDAPLLLHDVRLRNTSPRARTIIWSEVWTPNPYIPGLQLHRGVTAPKLSARSRTVTVDQKPVADDRTPDRIFAASLTAPVAGHHGFTLKARVRLPPHATRMLRYAFGAAPAGRIRALVARYRSAQDPFAASERAWQRVLPRADLGPRHRWLARELQWDAYMVKSGETFESCAGHHVVSQGGYYQYGLGFQGAFRDPLQHVLPLIYSDPAVARETLLYSAEEQDPAVPQLPYARLPGCTRLDLGTSDDLDLWLLLTASEYGLASRDTAFFARRVRYADGTSATLWRHLERAFDHQESQRDPDGEYAAGTTGDWSDLITPFAHMTESNLVVAQTAYVYPRLAELADLRGDRAFAARLRAAGRRSLATLRRQWVPAGWYARGYAGPSQLGRGVIYGEPQPWAILARAPGAAQARRLVHEIRRFLTGIGAPGGPSRIGSSQSPAADDPGVHERTAAAVNLGVGDNHAVFVGGSWFAVNGWLTWALGTLDGVVPHARALAFDELVRNTLARHATVYPRHWDGIISVDDACRSWYSSHPERCGVGLTTAYDTEIMHQPAWSLFAMIKLAGLEPTARGYTIAPHLPFRRFTLELPRAGVAVRPGLVRGYIRTVAPSRMTLRVRAAGRVFVDGRRVRARRAGGFASFTVRTRPGRAVDWAVVR